MRAFRLRRIQVKAAPSLVVALLALTGCGSGSRDPEVGMLSGSPLDRLPPEVTQLTNFGLRADWSPDGRRILFLDALAGDVWAYELGTNVYAKDLGCYVQLKKFDETKSTYECRVVAPPPCRSRGHRLCSRRVPIPNRVHPPAGRHRGSKASCPPA